MGTVMHGVSESGADKVPLLISAANLGYTALKNYAPMLRAQRLHGGQRDLQRRRGHRPRGEALARRHERRLRERRAAGRLPLRDPWDPAMIVVSALRKLGPDATATQIRDYIAGLRGFVADQRPLRLRQGAAARAGRGQCVRRALGRPGRQVRPGQSRRRRPGTLSFRAPARYAATHAAVEQDAAVAFDRRSRPRCAALISAA